MVTETKADESRVALTPAGVFSLREAGHTVMIEIGAGLGSYIPDDEFADAGSGDDRRGPTASGRSPTWW